ncbi:MAG: asparagine synthase (glutamine-hydrolyzing) [Oscillospiraceae bacterium]|nr:asparagine synthase (glutamine-hydrolyzing) [Oscillospiraceae bacterium]
MCAIAGFCSYKVDFKDNADRWNSVLREMRETVFRRGPDGSGEFLQSHIGLSHARLAIRDIAGGIQPMTRGNCTIVYNGEIYNANELRQGLESHGFRFETSGDTEVILNGFIHYGADFVKRLNGIFAFVIWNGEEVTLFRDRLGVKPLFYTIKDGILVFGSELKALFAHPEITPRITINAFREIFGVGPARTPGCGVFDGVHELLPGHYAVFTRGDGLKTVRYWNLESRPYESDCEETTEEVRLLLTDAIERQLESDVPVCSLLSGGVDSGIVTAVASKFLERNGKVLNTFSFDFTGNDLHFTSNEFQPERDRPYVEKMLARYNLNHTYLECAEKDLFELLFTSTDAKDLPGMADIDASLLYFCKEVSKHNKVTLTGECADEIFGGYPWFYREELLHAETFPWSRDLDTRKMLLSPDFVKELNLDEYVSERYENSLNQVPRLPGESGLDARRREITYLNIQWFMQTLLIRMDRASMYCGLEARVPFADHRVVELLWNVPWAQKYKNGTVKGLLRDAFREMLPREIMERKKSPYPKTYNPDYTKLLSRRLLEITGDSSSPLLPLIDVDKTRAFAQSPQEYGKPWFGQLMAGPQLMAYLIQVDYWLRKFKH